MTLRRTSLVILWSSVMAAVVPSIADAPLRPQLVQDVPSDLMALGQAEPGTLSAPANAGIRSTEPQRPPARPGAEPPLQTDLFETTANVPVSVRLYNGKQRSGEILVTHYRPNGPGPFPALVFMHGSKAGDRTEPKRFRYPGIARHFVRRGFAVLIATRLGYGDTGAEPFPETTIGGCSHIDHRRFVDALATQTSAAVAFARTLSWVDGNRVVLAGQSAGGLAVLATAGRGIPGLKGVLNFSGGIRWSPGKRPESGENCPLATSARLTGRPSPVPTLWIYAANDKLWGGQQPVDWFQEYLKGGGQGELVMFPSVGADGHAVMSFVPKWRGAVDRYLSDIGFPMPRSKMVPPDTGYAAIDDANRLPHVKDEVKTTAYPRFLNLDVPRAFAIAPNGGWSYSSGENASERALDECRRVNRRGCQLYAVDDFVVWPKR
jgi:dienelactone hydrolase